LELEQHRRGLANRADELQEAKAWLYAEGLSLFARKIQHNPELIQALGNLLNSMNLLGYTTCVKAGYACCRQGKQIEVVQPPIDTEASTKYHHATATFPNITFAIVETLRNNPDIPVEEL